MKDFKFKIEVTLKNGGEDEDRVYDWLVSHIFEIQDVVDVTEVTEAE